MAADTIARRIAAQRKAVEVARKRHAFELLVLRRLEARAGEGQSRALAAILKRAEARRDEAAQGLEGQGFEASSNGEKKEA